VIDGPTNGEFFRLYLDLSRGDVVVLDNLGGHKGKAAHASSEPSALTSS
jgi:hypothetical protein